MNKVNNVNIREINELPSPEKFIERIGKNEAQENFVSASRKEIAEILLGFDKRLLCIVGPCSIHDVDMGLEYAKRLRNLSYWVKDRMLLVMRVYFEKPRTSNGWKGLILDPHLDESADIIGGLTVARKFLAKLIDMELATATELLDPITPQYIGDLISWSAIGARTTQSQTHRQLASGLPMPLGFKNTTDGSIKTAIHAIMAAGNSQTFMGINEKGVASYIITNGNPNCHIILRGGIKGENYQKESIVEVEEKLEEHQLPKTIMVDCSHDNCNKDHNKQVEVFRSVMQQIEDGNSSIKAVMIESNLLEGQQAFSQKKYLEYGKSITDPCVSWETTEKLIWDGYEMLEGRFQMEVQSR